MMNTWLMRRPVRSPVSLRDDRAEQLVAVQAALHQQLGLALRGPAPPLSPPRAWLCGASTIRGLTELRCRAPRRSRGSSRSGPTRIGTISPCSPASIAPRQRRFLAGMGDRGRHRLEAATSSEQRSYFPVPGVRSMAPRAVASPAAGSPVRFLSGRTSERSASATPNSSGANAVW